MQGAAAMNGNWDLDAFLRSPTFSDLDRRFAKFVVQASKDGAPAIPLVGMAAALVSYQLSRGNVFLDLSNPPLWDESVEAPLADWPEVSVWMGALRESPAVGRPGDYRPLIATDSGKLYLQRYWCYEHFLAEKLRAFGAAGAMALPEATERELDRLFDGAEEQRQAASNALARPFSLISGGPGTGKTTTVLKILMLLLEREPDLAVRLAAPTGKAAARLQESIREGLAGVTCGEETKARLKGQEASTIHRLLGPIPGSVYFRHNERNPLAADVVILDEASMVDLPLMAKLVAALPATCRLIILGDKDQLASVEAGAVLGGMVESAAVTPAGADAPPLAGAVTLLTRNYRFGNESLIFRICNAVRDGDAEAALRHLQSGAGDDALWGYLPAPGRLKEELRPRVVAGFGDFVRKTEPEEALAALGQFQVLTALRKGPYGRENLNLLIEEILREEGLIATGKRHYAGRPLMVTENDYSVRLFNGDIGVLLKDKGGSLMGYFRNEDGTIRRISPLRLPFTQSAFAMTVHKSQGSEFGEVLMILPARDSRILTRELLYTAISRARKKVEVWSHEEVFEAAVSRRVARGQRSAFPVLYLSTPSAIKPST